MLKEDKYAHIEMPTLLSRTTLSQGSLTNKPGCNRRW